MRQYVRIICTAWLALIPLVHIKAAEAGATYLLGPDDQVTIRVLNLPEIGTAPYRIDMHGEINVPLAGRVKAAGLTVAQLEAELGGQLKEYLQSPSETVSVFEFSSQPVS